MECLSSVVNCVSGFQLHMIVQPDPVLQLGKHVEGHVLTLSSLVLTL